MGVTNGQAANETTFNTAFVDKTSNETVGGNKTLSGSTVFSKAFSTTRGDVASAASITSFDSTEGFKKLTGSTATTIHGIVAGTDGQELCLFNGSTADATLKHQSGSAGAAAQRIILPDAADLSIAANTGVMLKYDGNQSRWVLISGGGGDSGYVITGSRASPQSISAAGGIAFTGTRKDNLWFIQGDTAASDIDVSANPQIAAATAVGQKLTLVGRSNTQRVYLEDGNGLAMAYGPITIGENTIIEFVWDGTNWVEIARNG